MKYKIMVGKSVTKFIDKLPLSTRERLYKAMFQLPAKGDIKALVGHRGVFRLRVGNYRVIYSIEHDVLTVFVLEIGNRGDVYK